MVDEPSLGASGARPFLIDLCHATSRNARPYVQNGAAPKKFVEAAIDASPNLALLTDLANMDKHRRLNKPPGSEKSR